MLILIAGKSSFRKSKGFTTNIHNGLICWFTSNFSVKTIKTIFRIFQGCILCELTMIIIYRNPLSFDRFDNDRLTHAMTRILGLGWDKKSSGQTKTIQFLCSLQLFQSRMKLSWTGVWSWANAVLKWTELSRK